MQQSILRRLWPIAAILFLLSLSGCDSPEDVNQSASNSEERPTETVLVKTIHLKQDLSPALIERFSGVVKPIRSSDLSFTRSGKVAEIFIDVGSTVKQGEVLAQLDDELFFTKKVALQSKLESVEADLTTLYQQKANQSNEQMVAKINQLRLELDQIERDVQNSIPTSGNLNRRLNSNEEQIQSLNQKSRQLKIADLTEQVNNIKGQLQEADATIAACKMTAPFKGVIIEKMIEPGSVVAPGHPALKIADTDTYLVWVRLPTAFAANLKPGQEVSFEKDQQKILGQVTSIHPTVDPLTQTRTVVLKSDNLKAKDTLTSGERVEALFPAAEQKSGFWLPISTLRKEIAGVWSIYLVETIDEKPTVVRHYVEVIDVGNDQALVRGNLREGMSVIVDGLHRIVPGQSVRLAGEKKTVLDGKQKPERVPSL